MLWQLLQAATEVEGVAGMSGGIVEGIAKKLGRKNLSQGMIPRKRKMKRNNMGRIIKN